MIANDSFQRADTEYMQKYQANESSGDNENKDMSGLFNAAEIGA
jgi:hypothetical protein